MLRAESVTSQAGGKGVNISRAAVAAGVPTIAVLPAHKDDPFVVELLRDGIDCRPEQPAGAVRVNLTLTEPDGTTTKINSPGAVVARADLDRLAAAVTAARPAGRAGWCSPARCRRARRTAWYAELVGALRRHRRPGRRRHLAARRWCALAAGLEQHGARPDEAQRRGARLPHRRRRRGRSRPTRPPPPRPPQVLRRRAASARCWPRSAAPARCWSPPRAPGTPPRRPTTVVSTVGAGDSSLFGYLLGDLRGARAGRAAAPRGRLRQRRRRPARHHDPRPRRTPVPTSSRSASSPRPHPPGCPHRELRKR